MKSLRNAESAGLQEIKKGLMNGIGFGSQELRGGDPSAHAGLCRRSGVKLFIAAFVSFVCMAAILSRPAIAQVLFGSVVGTVTDASGSAIPDAAVTITNLQTNETRSAQANGGGLYTVSTVPAGMYKVSISKQGFNSFANPSVEVIANEVLRVDAQLQVGAVAQTVEVHSQAVALQTDTADVHSEIPSQSLETLPQATRSYQGVLNLVPGMVPPGGQLAGGTNNPSKSMQFAANGTGTQGPNVRIEGVSATNPWVQQYTTFVPSVEAIQSINVVTNSPDAEQGLSGGPSVTVQLKSGSNQVHGEFYEYNITNATSARSFFQAVGQKAPHQVDNDTGGNIGGHILRNKLFYFGGYEGDYIIQDYSGIISTPTQAMLAGNFSGSSTPIYDPSTGNANGSGRKPFPGNMIPATRISPVVKQLIPLIPAPNLQGIVNNYLVSQPTVYNLHKIDTKIDYQATTKLRISGRYGYQPYNNIQNPLFGPILGGASAGWPAFSAASGGNTFQHGATLAISVSATFVINPTLVLDGTFGETKVHEYLFPVLSNQKYGSDVLGIPGVNVGILPWAGGMPDFGIANYGGPTNPTFGASYPPLQYIDPVFEYSANLTKIKGSHNIRVGEDITRVHMNHIEVRNTLFQFTGGVTSIPGGASPNAYNAVADFLLGLDQTGQVWSQPAQPFITLREWAFALYARDQWQVSHKLTINYGTRWEHYPVPTQASRGIQYNNLLSDINNPTMELCGVGGNPGDCGIQVSWKLFAPSIGIAYRASNTLVVRGGYALSPTQTSMAQSVMQSFPSTLEAVYTGASSVLPAQSTLAAGFPIIPNPDVSTGTVAIPFGAGNVNTNPKNYIRGYVQSYNLMIQKDLGWGFVAQGGYVGTHVVHQDAAVNWNYGQVGGGAASQPLYRYGITGTTTSFQPAIFDLYNSLQLSVMRRLTNGLSMQAAYTWSKDMQGGYLSTGVAIPQDYYLNRSVTPVDRTNNLAISSLYQLPFGRDKPFLNHGFASAIVGGWTLNGTFYHLSGLPFSVAASGASCNCPGTTQRANQVKNIVAKGHVPHENGDGSSWFDPSAFAPVTTATLGSASYYSLRGPGATNLDASVFRDFQIWERLNMQFRAESLNVTNTPHFGVPSANVSSETISNGTVTALNGFSQITTLTPLGRLSDPRYFRFGVKFTF